MTLGTIGGSITRSAPESRRRWRVPGSGNQARVLGLPLPVGFVLLSIYQAPEGSLVGQPWTSDDSAQVGVLIYSILFLYRSLLWGVWVQHDQLVFHSWFRTHRVPIDTLELITIEQYSGLLNWGITDLWYWHPEMLIVRVKGQTEPIEVRGSLSFRKSALKQLEILHRVTGKAEYKVKPPKPEGQGPRHRLPH